MGTDYRKLCMELFGTDDVKELRRIAEEKMRDIEAAYAYFRNKFGK